MGAILEHWDVIATITVPILSICGTIGWAAGNYVLKTNDKTLAELALAIAELREQNRLMCETYQKDSKMFVTTEDCKADSRDCNAQRDVFRLSIEKKIDDLHVIANSQDLKRHEHNNRNQVYFLEICERLASVEAALGVKTTFPMNRGRRSSDIV